MCFFLSWLDGITGSHPGFKTAEHWGNLTEVIFKQYGRRTGARFFAGSGAVGDDPLFWIEFTEAGFQFLQRDVDRARDVSALVGIGASHVDEEGGARVEGGFRVGQADARNLGVGGLPKRRGRRRVGGRILSRQQDRGNDQQHSAADGEENWDL